MADRLLGAAGRLVNIVLRWYPDQFRRQVGRDLANTFRLEGERVFRLGGLIALIWYVTHNLAALAAGAVPEHLAMRRRRGRHRRRRGMFTSLGSDLRYALRGLVRAPGFSLTAVATIGVGVGMTTAIFTLVYGVVLRPLPYAEPDRLVRIHQQSGPSNRWPLSVVDYQAIAEHQQSLTGVGAIEWGNVTLTGWGVPERLRAGWVTNGLFDVLGVDAHEGRLIRSTVDTPDRDPTVVVSHGFRQRVFGEERAVGRTLILDGTSFTVVGVLPPTHATLAGVRADLWPVRHFDPPTRRGPFFIRAVGRLRSDVDFDGARRDLAAISERIFPLWASGFQDRTARLTPTRLQQEIVGETGRTLVLFLAGVGLMLLIGIANVANLMLVRNTGREREMALRTSLGATRGRLARQLATEAAVIAGCGGLLGLAVASVGLDLLLTLGPDLPRMGQVSINGAALGFGFAVTAACAVLIALAPAFHSARADLAPSLHAGGRGQTDERRWARVRGVLVTVEFALALPLLAGSLLLVTSLVQLQRVEVGIEANQVMTASVSLPPHTYPDRSSIQRFWDQVLPRIRELPGIASAAVTSNLPPDRPTGTNNFNLRDRPVPPGATQPSTPWVMVTPAYFGAMGIPLLQGRLLEATDTFGTPEVIVVSRQWAERFYPGEDPIGRQLYAGGCTEDTCAPVTVVGVVGNVKYRGLNALDDAAVYQPFPQFPWRTVSLVVRAEGDRAGAMQRARAALQRFDPNLAVANVAPMSDRIDEALAQPRYWALLATVFGAVGTLLAAIGVYGVLTYSVARRTRDIGVRMALGATRGSVQRLVLRHGLGYAAAGSVVGLGLTLVVQRWLDRLLFGVTAGNGLALAAILVCMLSVAVIACLLPARRATRVDPVVALAAD